MFLFLFFSCAQAAVILYLRRHASFAESKWTFLLLEAIITFATISWYLLSQKTSLPKADAITTVRPSTIATSSPAKEMKPSQKENNEELTQKISSLQEALSHLSQAEESSKKRIQDLEQERDTLREKILQEETLRDTAIANNERYGPLIFSLSTEIENLSAHVEEIKKHHAIEIRALLGKEEAQGGKKQRTTTKSLSLRPAVSPLASALLLLTACHKGLSLQNASWPANEHALLVRRKFFDIVSSHASMPIAIVSLDAPSDYFISPKLPKECSILSLTTHIAPHVKALSSLRPFEPYFISHDSLPLIAFRIAWNNLDDLVALVPQYTQTS